MTLKRLSFLMLVLFLYSITAALFATASPDDGAMLYRKHCTGCHPDPAALKSTENLAELLRQPPVAMPAFDTERLSDSSVVAIENFMRQRRNAGETAAPAAAPEPIAPTGSISSTGSGTAPGADAVSTPVPQPKKSAESAKLPREKKPRQRRLVRSWTIKGLRNGEAATLLKFEITANAHSELSVIPSISLSDYAVKVTAFDISDTSLKLELTWSWKNSPSYWKIETYQLTLSGTERSCPGRITCGPQAART